MYQNKKVILIVPVFNERGRINEVVKKTKGTSIDEVCMANDGSDDGSDDVARHLGATVLSHQKRMGIGAAIRTGIKHALADNFDIIVVCAGNNKDNPQEVDGLLKPIVEDGYDYIQGSRYLKGGKWGNMPLHRKIGCPLFALLYSFLMGKRFTDVTNGFRAYTTKFIQDKRINIDQKWLDGYDLEFYLQYKAITLGYKIREVPVTKIYPNKKTTKINNPLTSLWIVLKPLILLKLGFKK
ncbi:MAG: glycosyltransferase family 2 protein [Candidatus Portnoybacteria bacterium]